MKIPKNITTAIFDLDGTLLDSMHVWDKVDSDFFEKRGMVSPEDYTTAICTMTIDEIAVYTKERFDFPQEPQELIDEWISMADDEYRKNVPLKEGAREYLLYVKEKGLKMGVLTSLSTELALPALKRCGVLELFDVIVSSSETGVAKNTVDAYKDVAEKLGENTENCMFFDDTFPAVFTAKKAGMTVIGVFEETAPEMQEDIKKEADYYITRWQDAPKF